MIAKLATLKSPNNPSSTSNRESIVGKSSDRLATQKKSASQFSKHTDKAKVIVPPSPLYENKNFG